MKKITVIFCGIAIFCLSFKPVRNVDVYSSDDRKTVNLIGGLSQQDVAEKVLNKLKVLNQYYETNRNYAVDVTHMLFSSVDNPVVEERFTGFYKTMDGMEHSLLLGIETVQNHEIRVNIDTNSHTISISNVQKPVVFSITELKQSMKVSRNIKLSESDSLDIISFEFDVTRYPLYKLDIAISKNRIVSIDMYHAEKTDNNKGEKVYPHTRVEYSNYVENLRMKKRDFDVSDIVVKTDNTYEPDNAYKDYRIYDLRVKK